MGKSEQFIEETIRICEDADFAKLHQSLNGGDGIYAEEVIERLKEVHKRLYDDRPAPDEGDDLVPFPAMIKNTCSENVLLGVGICHVIPLPKDHLLSVFLDGNLIRTVGMMIPVEYQKMGIEREDMISETGDVEITIFDGDRKIIQSIISNQLAQPDEEPEYDEAVGMTQG